VFTGTVGVVAFAATLDGLERIAGLVCGIAAGALVWRAARDRERGQLSTPMIWHLVLTACAVLALVVVLDSREIDGQTTAPPSGLEPATQAPRGGGSPDTTTAGTARFLVDFESVERRNEWSPGAPSIASVAYRNSLVVCAHHNCCADARPSIIFELDGRYGTFRATVGIDDGAPLARATFSVQRDDEPLRDSPSLVNGGTYAFEVPVTNVRRLHLIVSIETCGSSFVWGDARLS
jgi:F0F1-type ATP synthase membrane subunit c/vacuolar-type H+-ATPase subunit K